MEFQLREMKHEDKEIVFRFLQTHWKQGSVKCRPDRFEWQFERYPLDAKIYLCFNKKDDLIAQICFLPVNLRLKNERLSGAFSIDTMVAPEYRRKGIGGKLHKLRLENYQVALSSGQSKANANLYNKLGWLTLGEYFLVRLVKKLPKYQGLKSFIKDSLHYVNYKVRARRFNRNPRIIISRDFPKEMSISLDRGLRDEAFVEVDKDYLNWRYKEHPYYEYQYVQVLDGPKPLGLCVVREFKLGCYLLVDFFCPRGNFRPLLEGLAYSLEGYSIEGEMVAEPLRRYFLETGYTVTRTNHHIMGSSNDDNIFRKLSECDWLMFGGDSDNDR